MVKINKGMDIPLSGSPEQAIHDGKAVSSIAIIGDDYIGMKPTMEVKVGDKVKSGQILFSDKKTEGVHYTSPASGIVSAINRGERRVLQSIVIKLEDDHKEKFNQYDAKDIPTIDRSAVINNLVSSGLWTSLRTRPYSKVPSPTSEPPNSIFVTAIDTNPLAALPELIISQRKEDFQIGLSVLKHLTNGPVHLCIPEGSKVFESEQTCATLHKFSGPHPSGLVGTHIHFIDPVSATKTVWTIGYQDVIAVGALFTTGYIDPQRVVSLCGPQTLKPRLIRTIMGANINELVANELNDGESRVISGSILSGRIASASYLGGVFSFLGRYHTQITTILEGHQREFLRYISPGANRHSVLPIYLSSIGQTSEKKFNFTTNTNGSERAMVPVGNYEQVMPLDILPTQLLRALIVVDTEIAQKLGCLELEEEDLALCSYVCVGKYEYGPILRNNLSRIEQEG
jgi:Na+-transporting NADH:ubiquinone oxidoreductase subunit A